MAEGSAGFARHSNGYEYGDYDKRTARACERLVRVFEATKLDALLTREVHCVLRIIPLELPIRMNIKLSLFGLMAGMTFWVSGCAGLSGPNGLGQRVLVVCKTTPAQQAVGEKLSNQYFSQVASGKKARPVRRYVAVQTLDPDEKQREKYVKTRASVQQKAVSKGESLGADWVEPSSLHCVMIFDAVTHESVGTNCYVVGSLPKIDEVMTYDTFPAEFVASSAEFLSQ